METTLNIGDRIYYDVTHPFIQSAMQDMDEDEQVDLYKTRGVIVWFRGTAAVILNDDRTTSVVPPDCLVTDQSEDLFRFAPEPTDQ